MKRFDELNLKDSEILWQTIEMAIQNTPITKADIEAYMSDSLGFDNIEHILDSALERCDVTFKDENGKFDWDMYGDFIDDFGQEAFLLFIDRIESYL